MKKTNLIFAILIILLAFGQVEAQRKIFNRYEDPRTKEAIFIEQTMDNNYPPNSTYKIWYAPKYMDNIQKVTITKNPSADANPMQGLDFEVNIPNKGKCTFKYMGMGSQLIQNGITKHLMLANVFVNPQNKNEKIYNIAGGAFYAQTGSQKPIALEANFDKQNEYGTLAMKYKGKEYFMTTSSDGKLVLEDVSTKVKQYYLAPTLE